MEKKRNKKNHKGFSLIESLIGVAIAGVVFVTFLNILPKTIQAENYARDNIVATNFAQEGIEIVRNMRDNALKSNTCNQVFSSAGGCTISSPIDVSSSNDFLTEVIHINSLPAFNVPQFNGVKSKFYRSIGVTISGDTESATVNCTVTWSAGGSMKTVSIGDTLSAWGEKE